MPLRPLPNCREIFPSAMFNDSDGTPATKRLRNEEVVSHLLPKHSVAPVANASCSMAETSQNLVGGSLVTVNPYKRVLVNDKEIFKYETVEEKRSKAAFECKRLGIPKMTENGPCAGSIFPPEGAFWHFEYDQDNIPIKIVSIPKVQDESSQRMEITAPYRVWFRTFRDSFFPKLECRISPKDLETIYGAGVKLLKWARQNPENRQRLVSSEPMLSNSNNKAE